MAKIIKKIIPIIIKPILAKRNLTQAMIVLDWEKIVGPSIAPYARPERIKYDKGASSKGTLILAVASGWAPIIEHAKQQLVERINAFCGYQTISQIQLKQSLYTKPAEIRLQESEEEISVAEELVGIENVALKQALGNLKASLTRRK